MNNQNNKVWFDGRKRCVARSRLLTERANKFASHVMISAGVSFQGKGRLHFIEEKNKNQRRLLRKPVVAKISGRLSPVVWPTVYLPTRWIAYVSSKSDSAVACSPLSRLDKDSWPPNSPDINPLDYYVWRADA